MAAIVGAGFGGPINPRAYAAHFEDATEDVHDGDTFWVGETSVRLWGVDAPELNQTCRNRDDVRMCGEISRDHLISLLSRSLVQCVVATKMSGRADEDGDQKTVRETFGRPIVRCEVTKDPTNGSQVEPFDLAERMIRDGYAVMYRDRLAPMDGGNIDDLRNAELLAKRRRSGLLTLCWVEPGDWRDAGRTFRRAFEQDGLPADFRGSVIGQAELCPSSDNRH
jgi:endonuclease YncB( thermonuclease family)